MARGLEKDAKRHRKVIASLKWFPTHNKHVLWWILKQTESDLVVHQIRCFDGFGRSSNTIPEIRIFFMLIWMVSEDLPTSSKI